MLKKPLRKLFKNLPEPAVDLIDAKAEKVVRKALPKLLRGIGKVFR